jgi:formate hydrogenlyase transcriptional activator
MRRKRHWYYQKWDTVLPKLRFQRLYMGLPANGTSGKLRTSKAHKQVRLVWGKFMDSAIPYGLSDPGFCRQPTEAVDVDGPENRHRELGFEQIVGNSPALKHVLELVNTVASSDSTVLLLGETGTGKASIARAIHDRSRRQARSFVKLNCAAIPTCLLESEMFGHERGAFTGAFNRRIGRMELADQGTLFLDEVGDIPIEVQPKLLRAIQEREFERLGSTCTKRVNVRIVAATNRDLRSMIASREFRSDLYYRLNVFPIRIPPLRDRKEDIPLLATYFVHKFASQMHKSVHAIPPRVMEELSTWDWPGNIRELENFMERSMILSRGKFLDAPLSELRDFGPTRQEFQPAHAGYSASLKETIGCLHPERAPVEGYTKQQSEEIVVALIESNGRVGGPSGAAARLRVNRTTLIARMKKLRIDPRRFVRTKSVVEREPFLQRQEVLDKGSDLGPGGLRLPSLQGTG